MANEAKERSITMSTEPQPASSDTPASAETAPQKSNLIAPVWHTVVIAALLLGNSLIGSSKMAAVTGRRAPILLYIGTFIFELFVVLLILFWICRSGVSLRNLVGGPC